MHSEKPFKSPAAVVLTARLTDADAEIAQVLSERLSCCPPDGADLK
jgi:hypothetical protein